MLALRVMLALAASLRLIGATLLMTVNLLAACNDAKLAMTLAAVSTTVIVATLLSWPKVATRLAATPETLIGLAFVVSANFAATALVYCSLLRVVTLDARLMRSTKVLLARLVSSVAVTFVTVTSKPFRPATLPSKPEVV